MRYSKSLFLILAASLMVGCSNEAVEEGDYSTWTAGMVNIQQGDNTLYFVPTNGGLMLTMDRYNMTYEKLVQMNGGSISADNGGSGLVGVQTYQGDLVVPEEVNGMSVVAVDQYALASNQKLKSVKLPEKICQLGSESFALCSSLDSVEIPSKVKVLKPGVFAGAGVRKVIVPDGVEKISHFAFLKNTQLDSVKLNAASSQLSVIESSAFYGCSALRSCPLPDNLQEVGAYAFYGCSKLENTMIPVTASVVNPYQYYNCSSLTEITMPESIKEIGSNAFYGCSKIATYHLGDAHRIKKIGYRAFYNNQKLASFTFNEGLEDIGSQAFRDCRLLPEVILPEGIVAVKDSTFFNCRALATVKLPSTLQSIGSYAFYYCAMKSIEVPDGVKVIPSRGFFYCTKLMDVVLPESVTTLEDKAFANCTSLREIYLPSSLKSMGLNVFANCSKLTKIHVKSVEPPALLMSLDRKTATYYIPKGSLEAYQKAEYWKEITNYVEE